MTYELYCIRDRFSGYWSPRVFLNKPTAVRDFADMVNADHTSMVYQHPSDFSLYKVGTFNTDYGVNGFKDPELICEALALKKGEAITLEAEDFDDGE